MSESPRPRRTASDPAATEEEEESLWWLASAPAVWLVHLLACYLTAANYCAKANSETASLAGVRWAIAGYTAVALPLLLMLARRGWRRHQTGESLGPHDFDSRADRHRFLGFTLFLLSGAAILAVALAALPAAVLETCR